MKYITTLICYLCSIFLSLFNKKKVNQRKKDLKDLYDLLNNTETGQALNMDKLNAYATGSVLTLDVAYTDAQTTVIELTIFVHPRDLLNKGRFIKRWLYISKAKYIVKKIVNKKDFL